MIWGSWNNKSNATQNLTQWYKAALSEKADLYLCISSSAYILRWLCFFLFKGTTEPECFLEGMMLKLKLQFFGHLMRRIDLLEKIHAGRDWGQKEKGTTEDEMAGGHHWLDGCEFEWTRLQTGLQMEKISLESWVIWRAGLIWFDALSYILLFSWIPIFVTDMPWI